MQSKELATTQLSEMLQSVLSSGVSMRADGEQLRLEGDLARLDAGQVALIRQHKGAILALLARCDESLQLPAALPAAPIMSRTQQRHQARTERGHGAPLLCVASVQGTLSPAALATAVSALLLRHRVLCSGVEAAEGVFSHLQLPQSVQGDDLVRLVQAASERHPERPFQVMLLDTPEEQVLLMTAQRQVADDSSLQLLLRALADTYALEQASPSQCAAPADAAPPFAAFALAEQRMLAHPRNALRAAQASAILGPPLPPAAFCRPIAGCVLAVEPAGAADLPQLAAELGITPLAIAMAAFDVAASLSGCAQPLRFSVPYPNRATRCFAGTIGPLESSLVLALPVTGLEQSLSERAILAQAALSFGHDQQDLALQAEPQQPGCLAVRVAFTDRRGAAMPFGSATIEQWQPAPWTGDTALTLLHRASGGSLAAELHFDPVWLEQAVADNMMDHYVFLLGHARMLKDCVIAQLPACASARGPFLASRRADPAVTTAIVCAIFAAVLQIARVLPSENFFELAGNSLSVAKVVSRIKREFGVAVSFSEVFRFPTPQGLSTLILGRGSAAGPSLQHLAPLAQLPAAPQQVRYFASYNVDLAQTTRMTVLHSEWADAACFEEALQHVAERHELLRTAYVERDGVLMQHVLVAAVVPCDALAAEGDVTARRRTLDAHLRSQPFDLGKAPLMRAVTCTRAGGGIHAAVAVYNGILDAYSEGLLEDELRDSYALACTQELAQRAPLTLQYQDFARWQNELAHSPLKDTARRYWEQQFPLAYPAFHLASDTLCVRSGEMRVFLLGEELSEQARCAAAACESSLFGFLLANFVQLAAGIYQRDDVTVGLLYHGRENEEMENLIGYFVDALCLRCDVLPNQSFAELVRRVNDTLFRSIDMRTYQFQDLAARFGGAPNDPLFPVTGFHVNNVIVPGREKQVPADFVTQVLALPYVPKFDFNIYVHESNRGILVRMAYANSVVDTRTAEAITDRFVALVANNSLSKMKEVP